MNEPNLTQSINLYKLGMKIIILPSDLIKTNTTELYIHYWFIGRIPEKVTSYGGNGFRLAPNFCVGTVEWSIAEEKWNYNSVRIVRFKKNMEGRQIITRMIESLQRVKGLML